MTSYEPNSHQLHAADARILDWLVEHGFNASAVNELPEEDRARALAVLAQMNALDAYTVGAPDDSLVDAVVARIDRYEADRSAALNIASEGRVRRRLRLGDLIGIAALVMLSAAVLLPIASQVRAKSLEAVCANNLRSLGSGLASYASDHDGRMVMTAGLGSGMFSPSAPAAPSTPKPPAHETVAGSSAPQPPMRALISSSRDGMSITIIPDWGKYRHSDNLTKLVTDGYCDVHALNCPGCARGTACFAYRVPAAGSNYQLATPNRMVLAADANPVLEFRLKGRRIESSVLSSRNHVDRGQNLLFNDGTIEWHVSPVLSQQEATRFDNIWLPRGNDGLEQADLKCQPADPTDNFVAQ
jgi:hypothetical protein